MSLRQTIAAAVLTLGGLALPGTTGAVTVNYLYNLSDFSGVVPYNDVRLYADPLRDEVYAAMGNSIRVFNASGMEIFHFDGDPRLGTVFDLVADESGDLLLLTVSLDPLRSGPGWSITRCNYRGEPIGRVAVTGIPPDLASFRPNLMLRREGRLVLASMAQLRVMVIDRSGRFEKEYDLARLVGIKEKNRASHELFGLSMDDHGNLLFTIPTMFRAFVASPDGKVRSFGKPGSAPGSFSVASGIVSDDRGNVFIADKGRGVVLVFDRSLEFVTEFGMESSGRMSLIRPTDLAMGRGGKLYVTQARDRGVAVFQIVEITGSPPAP